MSSSFITNKDKFLSDIINGILPKTDAVDFLVGYFYFSGYVQLSENLKSKHIRILVGLDIEIQISKHVCEVENFRQKLLSRGVLKEQYYSEFVKAFNDTDFLDTAEKIEQFKMFYAKILDGTLEIRKTLDPCHSKMYLFVYNDSMNEGGELPGVMITGSSNLSYQGMQGRLELNARFNDKADYDEGHEIFEELWRDAVVIADQTNVDEWNNKVMAHIWYDTLFSPYLMFIRVLHEYFNIPTKENILTPYDITDGRYSNLKYQTDAVQLALRSLENHNGAIIADVVGLGKSVIAATVARNLHLRTIVVCPPHLCKQWEGYRDEFGFTASVFSAGKIEEALRHYQELKKPDEKFLIILDEAHRFRNEYTLDYALLHNLCIGNKVLLLTATPFNNQPADIYSLIKLFQIPSHSTLKTVENLGAAFKQLIDRYRELREAQRKGEVEDDEVKRTINSISKDIRSIISPLVIRRSRLDLQDIPDYAKDLKRQKIQLVIPNDPEELTYDLSQMKDLYLNTLDRISKSEGSTDDIARFKAARYSPVLYVKEDKKEQLAQELEEKTGIKFGLLIGRQANVSSFMRHLLVSRFESSMAAFQTSLGYMIQSAEHLLTWIDKRHKIPVYKKGNLPEVDDFYTDDGMEEIQEAFDKYENRGFFEIDMKYVEDNFIEDVKTDIHLLQSLREEWFGKENTIKHDPKLASFIEIAKKKLEQEPDRKLIVFSEYADTVDYLGKKLVEAGLPVMKYTSADASPNNKERIRANFDAGLKKELQRDDYKILVATDAISEGYNLHRAGAIFNYDIPYNPTRVIQRIGRINRINRKVFDELFIYNYFPSDVGEAETRTKEISTLKMAMIHAIMGEDTKALTKDEEVQAYFKERYRKEFQKNEESSWDTPYRKFLNEVKGTEAYQKALEIPHRARTARKKEKTDYGVLMFGRKGNDFVFKIGSEDGTPKMLSAEDALKLFAAEPSEEPVELSDWYAWAIKIIRFPNNIKDDKDDDKYNHESAIRLITRLIFVWFLKQRHLIPDEFFDQEYIANNLIENFCPHQKDGLFGFKSHESVYYKAILQNLFFAMLNSPITKEGCTEPTERRFRNGRGDYDNNKLMRYERYFKNPQLFIDLANKTVPFLNGGLFDCLDDKNNGIYYDGFSDRKEVGSKLIFPDYLFFGEEAGKNVDLSEFYGDKRKKRVSARGIIDILKRYNFTVEENTPFDKEVSLDPELLGKVFENLLAAYNPETQSTARKQTGSFYTPREIVQYMVDESLVAHVKRIVGEDIEPKFRRLLQYTDDPVDLSPEQRKAIMKALYECRVLDPACGSGAFPMGMLQQMVHILGRIDPDNVEWKKMMMDLAVGETTEAFQADSKEERKELLADIERSFDENINRPDYARKLYLIEHCIYGVDIQPIAIQISKLRFFISLVVDQRTNNDPADNFGIRPLPNLEAKFVAANTLIGLAKKDATLFDTDAIKEKEQALKLAKHKIFSAKTIRTKRKYRQQVNELRQELTNMMEETGAVGNKEARQLASWDMFDQNASSPFFDPQWMFDVKNGFDIVIANPPYISANELKKSLGDANYKYLKSLFQTSRGTVDMYVYFFEKGLDLLTDSGVLTYITPNKYLSANYGKALRSFFMANARIVTIVDVSRDNIFDADTYPIVSVFCKNTNDAVYQFTAVDKYRKAHTFESSQLSELPEYNWGFILSTKYDLSKKIISKSKSILNVCKINATSTASEADKFHSYIYNSYNSEEDGLKLINTGTIDPYCNYWGKHSLTDKSNHYLRPMLPNNFKVLGTNRYNLYNSSKIIVAKMSLRLEGFYDEKGEYSSINTNCLHHITISPLRLMGWIHSKAFQYIYECLFEGLRMAGNYLPFSAPYLSCMYIPLDIDSLDIEDLVTSIISAKQADPTADTSEQERAIDLMVYKLYGLTYDEVKVVDPEITITEEEYAKEK